MDLDLFFEVDGGFGLVVEFPDFVVKALVIVVVEIFMFFNPVIKIFEL